MSSTSAANQRQTDACENPAPTRLFRNGNSQAVRIPKALAFESVEVEIERRGDELIVRPAKRKLTGFGAAFRKLRPYFKDFRRDQPIQEERSWLGGIVLVRTNESSRQSRR